MPTVSYYGGIFSGEVITEKGGQCCVTAFCLPSPAEEGR